MVLFLYTQGPPPAAAEAADSGDGQGFSHLQVGGHADWHLPHGEFPEGTRPNRPALSPVSISAQPAASRGHGVRGTAQLAPGLSAGRWGSLPGLRVDRCARWTLELTAPCCPSPAGGCALLCRGVRQLLPGLWALSLRHQDGPAQPTCHAGAVHSLRG